MSSRCTYCLIELNRKNKTKDHVFPKSWFSNGDNSRRLTVPACKRCNFEFKKIEETLFLRWGLGIDSTQGPQDIPKRALDSINIITARNPEIRDIRKRALLNLIKDSHPYNPETVLKNLTPKEGVRSSIAIRTKNKGIIKFAEKIIRGLEYSLRGKLIEVDRTLKIFYVYDIGPKGMEETFVELMSQNPFEVDLGKSFKVTYGVNPHPQYSNQVIYNVKIWNHVEFWGTVG